jgi:hypothetical protein
MQNQKFKNYRKNKKKKKREKNKLKPQKNGIKKTGQITGN